MNTEVQIQSMNPWVSIWIKPRGTIRWIVETDPTRHVVLLAVVGGIANSLNLVEMFNLGDLLPLPIMLIFALVAGAIWGLPYIYIFGAILRWTGSWFGGEATRKEVRAAIAWSSVPSIWALMLWVPGLILLREELFTSPRLPYLSPSKDYDYLIVGFIYLRGVIAIWAGIVFFKCLGEVHGFSAWKAIGATIIPRFISLSIFLSCLRAMNFISY